MQRDLRHLAASHHPSGDASLPAPGLTLAWGVSPLATCYECHLHPCWLGCPAELWGTQDADPLVLPGCFGEHLSCPSWLTESVAAVLRKGMSRLGWMRVGGWESTGSGCGKEGRATWGPFLTGGCIGAIGKELQRRKQRSLLQETSQEPDSTALGSQHLWSRQREG